MKFTGFFWDFDGTLFDTYPRMTKSFQHALAVCGVQADEADILPRIKISVGSARDSYLGPCTDDLLRRFSEAYRSYERSLPPETMKPYPGMLELIRRTHALGAHHHLYTHRDHAALEALER